METSQWTFSTFKEYVDERFAAQDKAVNVGLTAQRTAIDAALAAQEKAVTKAETAAEKRFESVNEFRAQLATQQATFVTRAEYEAELRAIRSGTDVGAAALNAKIDDITARLNRSEGRGGGLQAGWGYLVGAIVVVNIVIGIVLTLLR